MEPGSLSSKDYVYMIYSNALILGSSDVTTKDVLIALRDKWSNDPSIYNPHEAPTLLSLMLLKETSE